MDSTIVTSDSERTARAAFLDGVKAVAPILVGVVPFALIAGVTAVSVGVHSPLQTHNFCR